MITMLWCFLLNKMTPPKSEDGMGLQVFIIMLALIFSILQDTYIIYLLGKIKF